MSNLVLANALNIPFSNDCFDRIFEVGVIEHFYQNDPFEGDVVDRELIIKSLLEIKRILKQDGKVGFIQPSKYSILPLSQKIDQILGNWQFGFQENFSVNDFSQLLVIAGFRNIKYCIIQAPDDFPLRIRIGDRILKSFYILTGKYRKAELVGALFCLTAEK